MPSSLSAAVLGSLAALLVAPAFGCGGSTSSASPGDGGSAEAASGDGGHDGGATGDAAGGIDSGGGADASGSTDAGHGGDAADSGGDTGAGDGGLSPGCPSSPPADGASCTVANLACEYGDDLLLGCDTVATCTGGTWHVQLPTNGLAACRGSTGGMDPGCPATSGAVPVGQACSPQMTCGYGDTVCYCFMDHTGAPQDWGCFPGTSGCPYPRPRVGSACTGSLQCDYSSCGDSIACTGGLWTVSNGGCHP